MMITANTAPAQMRETHRSEITCEIPSWVVSTSAAGSGIRQTRHHQPRRDGLELRPIAQVALDVVMRGWGREQDQTEQGIQERGEITVAFLVLDLTEAAIERENDQERGQRLGP
jgi:hypothetical protein